jgi:hypothetical protein
MSLKAKEPGWYVLTESWGLFTINPVMVLYLFCSEKWSDTKESLNEDISRC